MPQSSRRRRASPPPRRQTIHEAGRSHHRSTTKISDGSDGRHVRLGTDAFSRTTNSLLHLLLFLFRLPPSKLTKDKMQGESTDQPRPISNENWLERQLRVSPFYSARSVASLDTFPARFHIRISHGSTPGAIDAYLCAVIRRDNRRQRTPGRNVEN